MQTQNFQNFGKNSSLFIHRPEALIQTGTKLWFLLVTIALSHLLQPKFNQFSIKTWLNG